MAKQEAQLERQLRQAIRESGMSVYRLAKLSGVPQPVLSRFMNGTRGITLATTSKLASVLGLELRPTKRKGR